MASSVSFLAPTVRLQPIYLLRTSSNISRNISRPAVGTVGPAQILIWHYFTLYLLPKFTVAPEFHSFKYGNTHCLLRYSTDAEFTKTIARIYSTTRHCMSKFPSSCLVTQLLVLSFAFVQVLFVLLFVGRPPLSVPCPDKRGKSSG